MYNMWLRLWEVVLSNLPMAEPIFLNPPPKQATLNLEQFILFPRIIFGNNGKVCSSSISFEVLESVAASATCLSCQL